MSETAGSAASDRPLAGHVVVDLTRALAGPHAGMTLGDLGGEDIVATVLADEAHVGASYELCGSAATSVSEVADLAGLAVREIDVETWQSGPGAQVSAYARKALAAMFIYYDRYGLVGNGRSLEWLLGRAPRSVAEVISTSWPTALADDPAGRD